MIIAKFLVPTIACLQLAAGLETPSYCQSPSLNTTAFVFGATGAVGKQVINQLLGHPAYSKVVAVVRRPVSEEQLPAVFDSLSASNKHKLEVRIVDYENISANDLIRANQASVYERNVGYCCLGTTRGDAGSDQAFRRVDYDFVTNAGIASVAAGIKQFAVVSSMNADSSSMFLYPRTKGEADDKLATLGFQVLYIAKPGLMDRGSEARTVEKYAMWILPSITVRDVARGMIEAMESTNEASVGCEGGTPIVKSLSNADLLSGSKRLSDIIS